MKWFADLAAGFAAAVSFLVVALGTNPHGVALAAVLFVASVLWLVRPNDTDPSNERTRP